MDFERTRSFFPITAERVWLNHAGTGPLSARAAEAIGRWLELAQRRGDPRQPSPCEAEVERARASCARLVGARPEEIAFLRNTSEGLGTVAAGLDWRRGDRVLTCDLEYPANVYPWQALAERGVETLLLPGRDGRLPLESIDAALRDPAVRLLALSSVQYASGFRLDLPAVGALCRERGVLFCVDAIQSVGALRMDVGAAGIDFLACGGHKWLCGAEGAGLFYASAHLQGQLQPRLLGAKSVTTDFDAYDLRLREDARRFEEGTRNTAGIYALGAAADLLLELGSDAVEARVLGLTGHLVEGLVARGARITGAREAAERSGIVAFTLGDEPPEQTAARLCEMGFAVVVRRGYVRVSPHYYIRHAELDALLEAL